MRWYQRTYTLETYNYGTCRVGGEGAVVALWSLCWRKGERCLILPAAPAAAGAIGAEGAIGAKGAIGVEGDWRLQQSRRLRPRGWGSVHGPSTTRFLFAWTEICTLLSQAWIKTCPCQGFFFFPIGYRGWKIQCQYRVNKTSDLAFDYSALLDAGPLLNGNWYIIANVD